MQQIFIEGQLYVRLCFRQMNKVPYCDGDPVLR
jgi:hypothetical protein